MPKINTEKIDDLTNEIMDIVREEFKLNPDSDKDDKVYTKIWNTIKESED